MLEIIKFAAQSTNNLICTCLVLFIVGAFTLGIIDNIFTGISKIVSSKSAVKGAVTEAVKLMKEESDKREKILK